MHRIGHVDLPRQKKQWDSTQQQQGSLVIGFDQSGVLWNHYEEL